MLGRLVYGLGWVWGFLVERWARGHADGEMAGLRAVQGKR